MRCTKRFERRITTPYFKVGTLKKASGIGSVTLTAGSGVPLERLTIKGATVQEAPNRAINYLSIKNPNNYYPAGVNGTYYFKLPIGLSEKNLTYTLKKTGALGGAILNLSDGENALFSNLTPLCDSSGNVFKVSGNTFTHLIFTNVVTSDKEEVEGEVSVVLDGIINFWKACELVVTAEISPDFDTPVVCVGDSNATLTSEFGASKRTMTIPRYTIKQGLSPTFLLSEYDELEIRVRERKVIYRDGSAVIELTGNEPWQIYTPAATTGRGLFAYYTPSLIFTEGYCRYLDFATWPTNQAQKNIFTAINRTQLAIKFERNETTTALYQQALTEITTFLRKAYSAGLPATMILKRGVKQVRDVSNTQIGKILLAFHTSYKGNGTFSVSGTIPNPRLEIEYYSKEEGESAVLTVICQNELEAELSRAEHTIRMGSAYKLTAPEIDGYTPEQKELWGAVKEDKTIIIKYKEKQ